MALTNAQKAQIDAAYAAVNIQIERIKKSLRETPPRLKALADAGFHIERLMIDAQLVEHALKGVLRTLELKRTIWGILNISHPFEGKTIPFFEKKELGKLIELYMRLEGESELAVKLTDFKDRFRNEYIHHIFDGSNDIAQIDKEAQEYLDSVEFNGGVIVGLLAVQLRIQGEVNQMVRQHELT